MRGWPGHRRAEATPSFGRLCPAMTSVEAEAWVDKANRARVATAIAERWWARRFAPLPTLIWGFVSQGCWIGLGWILIETGRRAEPCAAQRDDRTPSEDWLPTIAAAHCITSYPVGSSDPYPHSACLRRGSHEDETHLQNGLVDPWVARSSSILRSG